MATTLARIGAGAETDAASFLPNPTTPRELSLLVSRHCRDGLTPTAIPRLNLSRSTARTALSPAIFTPLLCVLASGRKRVVLGRDEYRYDPNNYLIASAALPVRTQVVAAPCLAITLTIDPSLVADLLLGLPASSAHIPSSALGVSPLDDDLADALERLLRLLDRPADIPVLAGLIEREIVYRLLCGPQGEMLRQLARPSSQLAQISAAIAVIRLRYDEKIRVDELARAAGMSATSFHRHFRRVTAMSPLQYQKHIRLHEARRMLLSPSVDATRVSLDVGYESTSQFNREYRRLFGKPPARDAAELRRAMDGGAPVAFDRRVVERHAIR